MQVSVDIQQNRIPTDVVDKMPDNIPPEMAAWVVQQQKNVSTKHVVATIAAAIGSIGAVGVFVFIVIRLFLSLPDSWLEIGAIALLCIFLSLFGIGGALALVTMFRYIQRPGIQLPGFLGSIEEKFGLK